MARKPLYFYVRLWVLHSFEPRKLHKLLRRQSTLVAIRTEKKLYAWLPRTKSTGTIDALLTLIYNATAISNIVDDPTRKGVSLKKYQRMVRAGIWKPKGIRLRRKVTYS